MGYYSIYKIFKDIIRTIFGKKFLIILFLFILIFTSYIVLFKNISSAYFNDNGISNSFQVSYNNNTYDITVPESDLFDFDDVNAIYGVRNGDNLIFYVLVGYPDSTLKVRVDGSVNYIRNYVSATSNSELINANPYVYQFWYYMPTGLYWNNSTALENSIADNYSSNTYNFLYATKNVLRRSYTSSQNNTIYFSKNSVEIKYPTLANSLSDLQSLNFDVFSINGWDYSNDDIYVLFFDKNYQGTDTTDSLYPKRTIKLSRDSVYFKSELSANPNVNSIYWIPIEECGLNLYVGGTYAIKFALKIPRPTPVYGSTWYYHYLGEPILFTINSDVSQQKIDSLNNEIQETTEKKYHDETITSIDNLNNSVNNLNNNMNNINDALTNTTPNPSLNNDINNSLDFNNQNEGLNNLNNGFFSRLTSMLSNLLGYDLSQDTAVSIPLPNSNKNIVLHSNIIYNNVNGALRVIINAFWVYIFTFYMWKFINKIYIAISTGNILDTFSSSGEAITNDML